MRIGLIGNSHAGCLLAAWKDLRASTKGVSISSHVHRTYGTLPLIVKPGRGLEDIVFDDIQCAQRNEVLVDEIDCFYICGLGYSLDTLGKVYTKFRCSEQSLNRHTYLLSDAAFAATLHDKFDQSVVRRFLDILRSVTDKPIAYLQQPYPLEWVMTREIPSAGYFREMSASGDWSSVLGWHGRMLARLEECGFPVLRQPVETLKEPGLTLSKYGRADPADVDPDSAYSKYDYFHMAEEYGKVVLQQLVHHAKGAEKEG